MIDGANVGTSSVMDNREAVLRVELVKGKHKIAACFEDNEGREFSAYYLYINKI